MGNERVLQNYRKALENSRKRLEEEVQDSITVNFGTLEEKIIDTTDKTRNRKEKNMKGEEPVWMNEEIKGRRKVRRN